MPSLAYSEQKAYQSKLCYSVRMVMHIRLIGSLLTLLLVLTSVMSNAQAQVPAPTAEPGTANLPENTSREPTSPFLIEPDAQLKGDKIKQQTYKSQPAGENQNWNLDIGRFQEPIDTNPPLTDSEKLNENYTGMRLRLPLRGKTRE